MVSVGQHQGARTAQQFEARYPTSLDPLVYWQMSVSRARKRPTKVQLDKEAVDPRVLISL